MQTSYTGSLHETCTHMYHTAVHIHIHIRTHVLYSALFTIFTFTCSTPSYRALLHCNMRTRPVSASNIHLHAAHVVSRPSTYNRSSQHSIPTRPVLRRNLPSTLVALKKSLAEPQTLTLTLTDHYYQGKRFWAYWIRNDVAFRGNQTLNSLQ